MLHFARLSRLKPRPPSSTLGAKMSADRWAEPGNSTTLEKKREEVKGNEEAKVPLPDFRLAEASEHVNHGEPSEQSSQQEVTSGARRAKLQRRKKTSEKVSGVMWNFDTIVLEGKKKTPHTHTHRQT